MPRVVGYPKDRIGRSPTKTLALRLQQARDNLERGLRFRDETRQRKWRLAERAWEGTHWNPEDYTDPTADLVTVNMSFSTAATIVPFITGEEPRFLVTPLSGDATVFNARIQQILLNHLWRHPEVRGQDSLEHIVHDSILYGDGYGKVSWNVREKRVSEFGETAEIAEIHFDRINPWNVVIDPTSDGIHNARWVAERIFTTREELAADPRYKNVDQLSFGIWAYEMSPDGLIEQRMAENADGLQEWTVVWEFWDLANNMMITFGEGADAPLRVIEDIGACLIVQFPNHRLPNSPYNMGDIEQIWELNQELNKTRSEMMTHRRRNIAKYIGRRDLVDDNAIEALTSPVVGAIAWVEGDFDTNQIITPVNLAPLSADTYRISDQVFSDIYEITGVNEYLRGAAPEIRRTATEASIIEGASNVKTRHKLRKIETSLRSVGELMLGVAADIYPQTEYEELAMFITGEDAESVNRLAEGEQAIAASQAGLPPPQFSDTPADDAIIVPEPEIFRGVYNIEVVQNSTELRNPIFKEQKYREITLQVINAFPVLAQAGVTVNLRRLMELWFEAAGLPDIESLFTPGSSFQQGPAGQGSPSQLPPEIESLLQGGGPPAGQPNLAGVGAPSPTEISPLQLAEGI